MAQDKPALFALINTNLPDNDTKFITPEKHREVSTQLGDSALNVVDTAAQTVAGQVDFAGGLLKGGNELLTGATERQLIYASSTVADQLPSGVGVPLQVEFGPAQGDSSDPVMISAQGLVTFNETKNFLVRVKLQKGRSGSSGTSVLMSRVLKNGTQLGISSSAKMSNADDVSVLESKITVSAIPGDTMSLQIIRDSAGNNSGGLYSIPSSHGWNLSPTALIAISVVEGVV